MSESFLPDGQRRVYIVRIAEHLHPLLKDAVPEGKSCFYVGESARYPTSRLKQHLGGVKAAKVFRRLGRESERPLKNNEDVRLEWALMNDYPMTTDPYESQELEQKAIASLRAQGHLVYPAS